VMSTLHTLDASETINRIISTFPPHQQKQIRIQLGSVLKGVVSQRLVPRADGKGRVAAVEIMKATARIKEMIEDKDRTKEIPDAIAQGFTTYGMQTFDQSLMQLVRQNLVTYQEALRQATNPDDFALRFQGISSTSDAKWDDFDGTPGEQKAPPGSAQYVAQMNNTSQQNLQPVTRPTTPSQAGARAPFVPPAPAAAAPQRAAPAPAATSPKPAEEEFQIERF